MTKFDAVDSSSKDAINKFSGVDSGVNCVLALLRFYGIASDFVSLKKYSGFSGVNANLDDLVRQSRRHGLKARAVAGMTWENLVVTALPAIGQHSDRKIFFILVRIVGNKALILDGLTQKPELLTREQFESIWDGSLILITKRASLADLDKTFNISWFLTAVKKYRHLLGEVLIGSFMLNIFGLVSPLFFQVVVDKVLVHRDMSTLDVLMIGLVAVLVFESVLGALRTCVFCSITNRIDLELEQNFCGIFW